MNLTALAGLLALIVLLSGMASGSETGFYSVSRSRIDAEARAGSRAARLVLALLRDETGLLITLLLVNNVVNQAATYVGRELMAPLAVPDQLEELALTLWLAPLFFFLGELLPKDLFRRRPHALLFAVAPLVWVAKAVLAPIAWPLRGMIAAAGRALGLDTRELARVEGREAVLELLSESHAGLRPQLEGLARNVLELRALRVERVMVPWRRVEVLRAGAPGPAVREQLAATPYTRLPVVDARGAVLGYVHQLEVLAAGPSAPLAEALRPMIELDPSTPLDRALARMRASGQRAAVVGPGARPLGLVTLKDLVEEISGELARW